MYKLSSKGQINVQTKFIIIITHTKWIVQISS